MSNAGLQILAGRIPGERLATSIRIANSAGFTTTDTVTDSVTAPLVTGRLYLVKAYLLLRSTVANDTIVSRIREDALAGAQLLSARFTIHTTGSATNHVGILEVHYTAVATADKTFVSTSIRGSGTGTITAVAAASDPAYMSVDYISG